MMSEVERYYDSTSEGEWERLERHRVEFDITKRYLQEYISTPSRVLDVGAGPGRYSIFLANQGHQVTLLDLSAENIKLAREKSAALGINIERFIHANALELMEKVNGTYDVILCMGPLYHLPKERDRMKVIKSCLEKLNPNGLLFLAFISSYAPIIDFIKKYPENIVGYKENLLNYLKDGINIVSEENPGFTTAFFINPGEIDHFMSRFKNLEKRVITAVEGITAQSEAKINSLSREAYQEWLDLIYQTSTNPLTWASCEHFLYIGRKQ